MSRHEGEREGKVTGGNQVLIVEDDLREMGKKATKSMASLPFVMRTSRPIGSFFFFSLFGRRSDGAQPHLVNIQFQYVDCFFRS